MSTNDEEAAARRLERLKFDHARVIELIRATAAFEHAALRPPLLLNGGALVAFLALFGALATKEPKPPLDRLSASWALGIWISGLLLASIAYGLGYQSQHNFRRNRDRQIEAAELRDAGKPEGAGAAAALGTCYASSADRLRGIAKWLWAISLGLFIAGVIFGGRATSLF